MTKEEIIHMFHEAGAAAGWKPGVGNALVISYLTHFANIAAAKEREKCAQICDDVSARGSNHAYMLAKAIRTRGETK